MGEVGEDLIPFHNNALVHTSSTMTLIMVIFSAKFVFIRLPQKVEQDTDPHNAQHKRGYKECESERHRLLLKGGRP